MNTVMTYTVRSTEMYTMQEALARDRMRERERQARRARLSADMAAAHRWHYWASVAHRASAVAERHARRAETAAAR
jgi:hypothetical protein